MQGELCLPMLFRYPEPLLSALEVAQDRKLVGLADRLPFENSRQGPARIPCRQHFEIGGSVTRTIRIRQSAAMLDTAST